MLVPVSDIPAFDEQQVGVNTIIAPEIGFPAAIFKFATIVRCIMVVFDNLLVICVLALHYA